MQNQESGSNYESGVSRLDLLFLRILFFFKQEQNVLMTHFRYIGMSRAYTKGLATELKAESQTPAKTEVYEHIFSLSLKHDHLRFHADMGFADFS